MGKGEIETWGERKDERASEQKRKRGVRERTDRRTNIKSFVSPTTSDILCVFFVDRKDDPNKGHSFCISLKLIRYIASRSFIAFFFTIAAIFEGRIRNLTPSDFFFFFFFFLLFFLVLFMSDIWCDFDRIFGLLNWSTSSVVISRMELHHIGKENPGGNNMQKWDTTTSLQTRYFFAFAIFTWKIFLTVNLSFSLALLLSLFIFSFFFWKLLSEYSYLIHSRNRGAV